MSGKNRLTGSRPALRVALLALAAVLSARDGRAAQQFQGLCSYVKMEIRQQLALERVGFEATLTLTNNEGDASITNFSAALTFTSHDTPDGSAKDAADLFFVQPPTVKGITAIDGTGILPPGQTAVVTWFIIPKLSAGGTDPGGVQYDVGAQLGGSLYAQVIPADVLKVLPATITVKPDPQLEITYFQPRDVDGDDPFTPDVVETPIPFTLGVLVKNVGSGRAKDVRIVSEQPRIVENKEGLLLIAQLLGARVDDEPTKDASLTVNLGTIEPGRCRKGAWDMITSLSGEFTEFKASYTHASELGGRDTSVIKDMNAYFIVHEVLNDQPGRDNLKDFLADTLKDPEFIPDTLYESDCNTLPVNRLTDVSLADYTGLTARIRAKADFENWVYLRLDDPAQAKYKIARVVRSDGKVLNSDNYWTSIRYRRTDNAKLTYLSLFDFVALGDYEYTVTYEPATQDLIAPVTRLRFSGQVQSAGGAFYVLPETQLYFTAEDQSPVGTYYRLDGAGAFLPAYPFQLTVSGQHTVEFYSKDAAGNQEATQTATVVLSDQYPGVANLASDTDTLFFAGDSISVRPTKATIRFDGVATAAGLTAQAEVFRGAYGWATVAGTPSSPTASATATLAVSGENVDFYRYRLGSGTWSQEEAVSQPIALTGLSGTVQVSVVGRSRYGSYPADSDAVTVTWDVGAATVSVTGAPETPTGAAAASLAVVGSSRYCFRVDGTYFRPETAADGLIALTRLSEGAHRVDVIPRASESEACPADGPATSVRWTVDRQYGYRLPAGQRVRQLDLGAVGPGPVEFAWDGRSDAGAVVPPGWYTVKVTVMDALGRATSAVKLVQVDDMLADGGLLSDAGPAAQQEADASGAWAVWQDQRDGNWDIFAKNLADPASVPQAIAATPLNQERPRTDGRYVVWEDRQADGTWDIWAKELGTAAAALPITSTPAVDERRPAVSYPWVVYQAKPVANPAAPWQLRAYNLLTGTTETVDATGQDELDPAVHAERVVWQDFRDAGYGEIYLKDLRTGEVRRITDEPHAQYHPTISDDWIVWEDNRNTQFDLYGFDLRRNAEVRLTNTPENETRPRLNGNWLVCLEDSAGVGLLNLRILNLSNLAAVQLTNTPSPKETPSLASGELVWVDAASGVKRVMLGSLPDLQPVFDNRNTVAVTSGMATLQKDAFTLLRRWNEEAGVLELTRYTALLPRPVAETATWDAGAPSGVDFPLDPGSFLWVKFGASRILDLGANRCDAPSLAAGTNVLGFSCFPDGYSAYRLLRELGLATVAAVRVLDSETGRWSAASVVGGEIVGEDFMIPRVAVLLLEMQAPVTSWRPGVRP